jgi:hypothetical protein
MLAPNAARHFVLQKVQLALLALGRQTWTRLDCPLCAISASEVKRIELDGVRTTYSLARQP